MAIRRLEVEDHALLVAIEGAEETDAETGELARAVAARGLHLDHLRAEVCEDHAARRPHHHVGEFDDAHAVERKRAHPVTLAIHLVIRSRRSAMTSASFRPVRAGTWNEWSASSNISSVARSPRRFTIGSSNVRSARASREPWRKSIGTFTWKRCAGRSSEGFPAACNGNPIKPRPRTVANGSTDCACEVMRPPKDLPPAKRGMPGIRFAASATAPRTAACATLGGSGRFDFASMYGNW